ncbi:MAG TPA: anthranilate phosphoribosyltransferase [Thermoanaerobaculia bacterium]|nr:anthranilate phosphoribosyltransferase [Thermoanaerobaculia bacterium]
MTSPASSSAAAAPPAPERAALERWIAGHDLDRAEMEALFGRLMDGAISPILQAALLAALATKGETAAEIAGAARAMRARAIRVPHHREGVVDTCGTGGDGGGTFNISTAAALVAAAAGVPMAKHGNRSVSSRCGSADVLEALGVAVQVTPESAARALDEIGIAFLFAPSLHPAMKQVMPVRRELGVCTVFNLLGPLVNPAGARRQLLGVPQPRWVDTHAAVLAELGCDHALVVHGDGLDEITTTGETTIAEVRDGEVSRYTVRPEDFGLARARRGALAGGDIGENAGIMLRVLRGEPGPLYDVTALNAGGAIYVGGLAASLAGGVARAREVLDGGDALARLEALRACS